MGEELCIEPSFPCQAQNIHCYEIDPQDETFLYENLLSYSPNSTQTAQCTPG